MELESWLVSTIARSLAFSTPLLWAALGEIYAERSGVVNLGVEGMMILGAVAGFMAAQTTGSPLVGLVAAVALGAALLGYIFPLASALEHTVSLLEFAVWALLAGVIQIVAFTIVRAVVMRDFSDRIVRGELAAAIYMASISLGVGLLNAACMSA